MPRPERTPHELATLYKDLFEDHPGGQVVLDHLQTLFCRRPDPNDFTPEGMLRGFVRTHQREVIEHIVRMINRAHGVEEPTTTEEDDHG